MFKNTTVLVIIMLFDLFAFISPAVVAQNSNIDKTVMKTDAVDTDTMATRIPVEQLVPVFESKALDKRERLKALHTMYQNRKLLSKPEQMMFWQSTSDIANDKTEDPQLRADAIWVFGGMGMLLKHEKTLNQQIVSKECHFLLEAAADESENIKVRRISIATLRDLKVKEAVPIVKILLADKANLNRPEILRSASITLAELAPDEALKPIGQVLSETTNPSVFGTAAYALGRINSPDALPLLVENRLRLGDNLSVDNAIEATSGTVLAILAQPKDPNIVVSIKATRSLWREEQKLAYTPLLFSILSNKTLPYETRNEALKRLLEDSNMHNLDRRKNEVERLLPLIAGEKAFEDEIKRINLILNAQLVPVYGK